MVEVRFGFQYMNKWFNSFNFIEDLIYLHCRRYSAVGSRNRHSFSVFFNVFSGSLQLKFDMMKQSQFLRNICMHGEVQCERNVKAANVTGHIFLRLTKNVILHTNERITYFESTNAFFHWLAPVV